MCYKVFSSLCPFPLSLSPSKNMGKKASGNDPLVYLKMTPYIHSPHTYLRSVPGN